MTRLTLRLSGLALAGLSFLAMTGMGCNKSDKPRSVTGVVKYNGKELPGGSITFMGGADGKTSTTTLIDTDGKYTMPNAPLGEVKISVVGPTRSSDASASAKPPVVLPQKYSDPAKSGLTYTVPEGASTKDIDLQ